MLHLWWVEQMERVLILLVYIAVVTGTATLPSTRRPTTITQPQLGMIFGDSVNIVMIKAAKKQNDNLYQPSAQKGTMIKNVFPGIAPTDTTSQSHTRMWSPTQCLTPCNLSRRSTTTKSTPPRRCLQSRMYHLPSHQCLMLNRCPSNSVLSVYFFSSLTFVKGRISFYSDYFQVLCTIQESRTQPLDSL